MSAFDKLVSAITPPESEEKREKAHAKARAEALPGGWLSQILDQHEAIAQAFSEVKAAPEPRTRRLGEKRLSMLLTGHAMAEEAVVYPALAQVHEQGHAHKAYTEQAAAKMQLAVLETIDPMSQDYLDKLGHLEGAIMHHVFEEENEWLLELQTRATTTENERITARFREEFDRYMGPEAPRPGAASIRPDLEPRSFTADRPSPG
jgi:hypothetical protein